MEDINISNVDFGSSLPKWATDETLKRLRSMLERQHNLSAKDRNKVIQLLSRMYQNDNKQLSNDKSMLQEMRSLKGILDKTHKIHSKGTSNKDVKDISTSNKRIEGLLRETNKSLKEISKMDMGGSYSPSEINKKDSGNTVDSSNITKAIYNSTKDIVRAINDNKSDTIIKNIAGTDDTGFDNNRKFYNDVTTAIDKSRTENTKSIKGLYDRNERIASILEKQNKNQMIHATRRNNRIESVLNNINKKRGMAGNMGGRNAPNTNSRLKRSMAQLGRVVGMIGRLAKFVPVIGGIVTALSSVAALVTAAAGSIKEHAWTLQQEYKGMLKSGFSFAQEIAEGTAMDGLRLKTRINQAGMTMEHGMEIMEKNAVLFNNLGVDAVFGTISDLADMQMETGRSFQDEMMLSRDEISKFTSQYLASTMNIARTERQTADERRQSAQYFIEDARRFGQATGQGMQVIIDKMNEIRGTRDFRIAMMGRSDEEAGELDRVMTMLSSLNLGSDTMNMLMEGVMDLRGLGLGAVDGGMEFANALSSVVGSELGSEFTEMIRLAGSGEVGADKIGEMLEGLFEKFDVENLEINKDQLAVLQSGTERQRMAADAIIALQHGRKTAERGTGAEESTDLAVSQQEVESKIYNMRAELERVESELWNSESGRETLKGGLDIMASSADVGTRTVGLLGHILQGLFDGVSTIAKYIKGVIDGIWQLGSRIVDALPFTKSTEEREEQRIRSAVSGIFDDFKDQGSGEPQLNIVSERLNEAGINARTRTSRGIINRSEVLDLGSSVNTTTSIDFFTDLMKRAESGDNEAANELKTILSQRMGGQTRRDLTSLLQRIAINNELDMDLVRASLSNNDEERERVRREAERDAQLEGAGAGIETEEELTGMEGAERDARQQVNNAIEETMSSQNTNQQQPLPPDVDMPRNNQSSLRNTTQEMQQENERRAEDAQRRAEEAEQRQRQQEQQAASEESPDTLTQQIPQHIRVDTNNEELLESLNKLNYQFEELIRLQRKFNSDLTIEIIRA